jgi:hypothetical protein
MRYTAERVVFESRTAFDINTYAGEGSGEGF